MEDVAHSRTREWDTNHDEQDGPRLFDYCA